MSHRAIGGALLLALEPIGTVRQVCELVAWSTANTQNWPPDTRAAVL